MGDWYYTGTSLTTNRPTDARKGGQWKGNKKLSFFAVDEAGHSAAGDQREAVYAVVRDWFS